MEELAEEFDGDFECLGENTEKYITFSVPIKKEIKNKQGRSRHRIFRGGRFYKSCYSSIEGGATMVGTDVPEKILDF